MDVGFGVEAAHPLRKMAGNKIMSWDFFICCLSIKVWDARLYAWIFFYTPLCRMVFLENPKMQDLDNLLHVQPVGSALSRRSRLPRTEEGLQPAPPRGQKKMPSPFRRGASHLAHNLSQSG